jgi:catechol 2,3-dioxygenase-like lactoylglutathione lyase family enzyme
MSLPGATKGGSMAKIKHIAVATQDPEKTAQFYKEVFGMREIAKINSPGATGFHLTDGDINFAVLKFKNDRTAGVPQGKTYTGLHHIGFEVDSIEDVEEKLATAGAPVRDDINSALGLGRSQPSHVNVEIKYGAPDGVIIDISETGWAGTAKHPR